MSAFPFIGQAYADRAGTVESQQCINLFLEADPGGRNALLGTPGLALFATVGNGPMRALWKVATGDLIAVSGANVYRIGKDKTTTLIGGIGTTTGTVSMADNGLQCVIVDGSQQGAQIDLKTYVMTPLVDAAFYGSDNVYFLDGRFIFNRPGTGQFYLSKMYSTAFDPLYFATAESSPDNLISHIVDHREIWLFGDITTEVWSANGAPTFPYERLQGASIEMGCAAAHSVCRMDNSIVWLGRDEKGAGIVWQVVNYAPARISTHAIEYAIAGYAKTVGISDAIAYVYQQEGHTFYVLTFPAANATWVYDAATKTWHQRAYLVAGVQNRHRSNCHAFAWNQNLVGDWQSGNIYVMDMDVLTDNGNPIRRVRSCAPLVDPDFDWVYFDNMQIEVESGTGLVTGQGSDPQMMMSYSNDGGKTWTPERSVSMGAIGQYKARCRWIRLGRSRDRVFRVAVADPVKVAIVNAVVNQGKS